jgi:hypothetical protein
MKAKEKTKVETEFKDACLRLGTYRQLFCWGAFPLFEEKSSGAVKLKEEMVELKNLAKVKSDIFSHIAELEKDKGKGAVKCNKAQELTYNL